VEENSPSGAGVRNRGFLRSEAKVAKSDCQPEAGGAERRSGKMILDILRKFIPSFLISWYHFTLSLLGAFLYKFPSRKMIMIGITGTSGKSTVVDLVSRILEEAGYKVASLSSVKFKIQDKEWENTLKMTMPGRLALQKFLKQAVDANCQYCVLEVTSEGILQHRHRFIDFDVACLTNLSPEHIERHGSFENYRRAKAKLFQSLKSKNRVLDNKEIKKISIVNIDDKNSQFFLKFPAGKKYGFGIDKEPEITDFEYVKADHIEQDFLGTKALIWGTQFDFSLLAKFNIYNALVAICVGISQGIPIEICKIALEKVKGIPGRIEVAIQDPFKVIVDYAHTPVALQEVYEFSSNSKSKNSRMICVLGSCGGGRDKWKRPELGKIAAKFCDEIIVTNEDPYDEDPIKIIEQVFRGTSGKAKKILDRRVAIKEALSIAQPEDVVVITGKGSEPWMCVAGGKKISWDDRKIVKEELENLSK